MDAPTDAIPLLAERPLEELRRAVQDYTVNSLYELIGLPGRTALDRGDLIGVERALPAGERLSLLVRLFLLGQAAAEPDARRALAPLDPDAAGALLECEDGQVRSRFELRPFAEEDGPPWWVLSDWGSDVRPGPLAPDHVLGIGAAALTLARATVRQPVHRALDLGTGSGMQALHLSRHADRVTATDISERALRLAATTAALSGVAIDFRRGSFLEPVHGQRFDQIVANPPFVVSPGLAAGAGGYAYRDSGMTGDALAGVLLRDVPAALTDSGCASLLLNWAIGPDGDWQSRVAGWLADRGCDAWVWQREVADPGEYVSLWLRDAGERPGTRSWREGYLAWTDWFAETGIVAVGMGLVTLWRTDRAPVIVCEDVPQAVEQPIGAALPAWIARQRWLARCGDPDLLATRLRAGADVVLERSQRVGADGWETVRTRLQQSGGMRWEVDADDTIATLVAACDGTRPLWLLLELASVLLPDAGEEAIRRAALPVVRDLISRGLLEPAADAG